MKNKKWRLAKENEPSFNLTLQGYKSNTCSGKCIVHSTRVGESKMFLIKKITHRCKKMKKEGSNER